MPEQALLPNEDPAAGEPFQAAEGGSSIFARIRILLFVTAVIAAECFLAWLYLPSTSRTAAMAGASVEAQAKAAEQAKKAESEVVDWVEVDLGEFSVVAYQKGSGTTLRIDFHLWGMVHKKDYDEFLTLMEERLHRFREQIHFTIRSADTNDLTDAQLGLVKRKTLERTNKILGKPLLRVVIFDDFSLMEQ